MVPGNQTMRMYYILDSLNYGEPNQHLTSHASYQQKQWKLDSFSINLVMVWSIQIWCLKAMLMQVPPFWLLDFDVTVSLSVMHHRYRWDRRGVCMSLCANQMVLWVVIYCFKSSSVGAFTWSSLRWFQSMVVRTKKRVLMLFRLQCMNVELR